MNTNQNDTSPVLKVGCFKSPIVIGECVYKNGAVVAIGDKIDYKKQETCGHCGNKHMTDHNGIIEKITYFPGTGFAEMGDIIKIILDNGDVLQGDSENGF